jgi:hypothetical protein
MENWKSVVSYEGLYEVSSDGNVRSLRDNKGRARQVPKDLVLLKIGHHPHNIYYGVNIYKDKKGTMSSVHRLVATAFLDNPGNLPLVNHKDEKTLNNSVDNLEWCTHQYNQEYSLSKRVYRFLSPTNEVVLIKNVRKFARENGLNHAHLYQVAKGTIKSHKGWRNEI